LGASSSKIEEYKKLIRENGIAAAVAAADESGIIYSENFTEHHVADPIFSSPRPTSKNTVDTKPFNLAEHGSASKKIVLRSFDDECISANANLELLISDEMIPVESGTGADTEQSKPNVAVPTI